MSSRRSLKRLASITILGALACAASVAQSIDVQANIPFAFSAGTASMPAGKYEFRGNGLVVAIRRMDGIRTNEYVLTLDAQGPHGHGPCRLSFQQVGRKYFLTEVWDQSQAGREIPLPTR